ncbi:MAG: hypothetical protein ACJ796_23925 [Gemmatimonadaceae bacterium]
MRIAADISIWIVRIAGTLQLVTGALFWTGRAYTFLPLHIISGTLIVLTLGVVAVLALIAPTRRGLAVFGLLWGVALLAFGLRQAAILVGPMHWIVRVVHLVMGLAAMALAGTLGQAILAVMPARVHEPKRERQTVTS